MVLQKHRTVRDVITNVNACRSCSPCVTPFGLRDPDPLLVAVFADGFHDDSIDFPDGGQLFLDDFVLLSVSSEIVYRIADLIRTQVFHCQLFALHQFKHTGLPVKKDSNGQINGSR
jgi:hypothetical protein